MDLQVDVQANRPEFSINLTRVGVTNVKKLIKVTRRDKRPIILVSEFDLFVDLPSERKGANLSRNFEVMDEALEEALNAPVYEIEQFCGDVAEKLLERHEYASRAEVRMRSQYMVRRQTPSTGITTQEITNIFAETTTFRTDDKQHKTRRMIGAEVVGMTACPCAQEHVRELAEMRLKELDVAQAGIDAFLRDIPLATHNQRGRGTISIEVGTGYEVPLDTIIEIVEDSMSSKIYELLKRTDEAVVVETAHKNPKFVEDCVRVMAHKVVEAFPYLPDDSIVTIKQVNEESIHRHNAFAERVATLGELRQELAIEHEIEVKAFCQT
ncbi:MAG: GTP cyclohydrolase MptA [Halobacteriota archaeon]